MKTLIISTIIIISFSFTAKADHNKADNSSTVMSDTVKQSPLSILLSSYYDVKNSLVSGDENTAATKAEEFITAVNGISEKIIPEGTRNALLNDAGHISKTKDIKQQREHFASFSSNMYALIKAEKFNSQPVYYDYCPMKKAFWLSSDASIKNPYLGNTMLTCGRVTETLK